MNNCTILEEKKYKGRTYYKVITDSNKEYICRKVQDDDVEIVDYDEYKDIFKKKSGIKEAIKNTVMSLVLAGAITSSLSGCSKNKDSNAEPTKIEKQDDNFEMNNKVKGEDYYKTLTIEDLKKLGVTFKEISVFSSAVGGASIYEVDNLDFTKLPDNEIFEYIQKYNRKCVKSDQIDLDDTHTWDDCIELIKQKSIPEDYKKIFINGIEKYKTLGLDEGLPIFYNNIKNSNFVEDLRHPSAEFSAFNHQLIIGKADLKKDPNFMANKDLLVQRGIYTEEELNKILKEENYILTHELGHVISSYYDDETGKYMSNMSCYALVEPGTTKIIGLVDIGLFLSEGFADYVEFEALNEKPNKFYGYPINQCIYLAYKEMLGIDSIEELRKLNVSEIISKMIEKGFYNPFDCIAYSESPAQSDYTALYQMGNFDISQRNDYTELLKVLFDSYAYSELSNNESSKDIVGVFEKIVNDIKERVTTKTINGELCVEGTMGYNYISVTELEKYIEEFKTMTSFEYYLK